MRSIHRFCISSSILAGAAMVASAPALADEQVRQFDVPGQAAKDGIVIFARQAGIQILAPGSATQGRRTAPLKGRFTVSDGLRRLAASGHLRLVSFDGRTAVLADAQSPDRPIDPPPARLRAAPRPLATPVAAQTVAPAPAASPSPVEAQDAPPPGIVGTEAIVVTGSTSGRRTQFNSSSNVTLANAAELQRKAPRSVAETLELVPGIFVEATAGPASNNYSVRGLRGGGQTFITLEQDGLPILYGGGGADFYFQQDLSVDRMEAVEGGTSGVLAPNGAGATINFISRKLNFDKLGGAVRVSGTTYSDFRADAYLSGPVSDGLAYSLSGYFWSQRGQRKSSFRYNSYQVKGQIEKRFDDDGFVRLTLQRRDERDPYYADMPFAVDSSGKIGSVPGTDLKYDNILGEAFRSIAVPDASATGNRLRTFSGKDGIHTTSWTYRIDMEKPLADGVKLFARARYLDGNYDFNGIFPGSGSGTAGLASAVDYLTPGTSPIASTLTAGAAAFPGTAQFGIRDTLTGKVIAASDTATLNALNGNGLLQQTVLNHQTLSTKDFGSNFGVTWDARSDAIQNSLTVGGMYYDVKHRNDQSAVATLINDVRNNSHIYDVVALSAGGEVLGQLTNNGMLSYGNWGQGIYNDHVESLSGYFNDELTINDKLHIDFGARYEHQHVAVNIGNTATVNEAVPAGTPGLAQDVGSTFDGTYTRYAASYHDWAYTAGINYELTPNVSLYLRGAKGFQTNGGDTGGTHAPTDLTLYEGGVRLRTSFLSASIVGFRTLFKNQSYQFINPSDPANAVNALANNTTNGVQLDAEVRPTRYFTITATGVYQVPRLNNLRFDGAAQTQYEGNTPERTPKKLLTVTPTFTLPHGLGEIYGRWKYVGKIFADAGNGVALPSYSVFTIGTNLNLSDQLNLAVSVDNLTNAKGFTEGNPRQGQTQTIVNGYFYGRAIAGRNAMASLTYRF
ncbi:TonB-dependent receptor [Novosphingobium sp. SG916]|uniref:TonB-dependent receptor domain-containing protein n=2 Tax=unclassified Novosphingobium TaxID=2644732 RepID=UPI00146F8862|nr:TonB-dependent receptor [Novosphingobium sp. SG916]NMN05174.1 outer membrane receptor protein involved in Fe transport [Novosphingobium sp. SG919]